MDLTVEYKARRGQEILDDPVFVEMIASVRKSIILQWTLTEPGSVGERETLSAANRALDEILRELRILVADQTMDQSHKKNRKGREQ